jgi:hypothetical protein
MEIFSIKNLKFGEGTEQYQIIIPNTFVALKNLDDCKGLEKIL